MQLTNPYNFSRSTTVIWKGNISDDLKGVLYNFTNFPATCVPAGPPPTIIICLFDVVVSVVDITINIYTRLSRFDSICFNMYAILYEGYKLL